LATFGLSYCIGPIAGGFLGERLSMTAVFYTSVLLAAFTVAYILFLLPESRPGNR
jgi:predicted MFS family arabinose efflux permease